MTETLLLVSGTFLIGLAIGDAIWTTLVLGGDGPLTAKLSIALWRLLPRGPHRHAWVRLILFAGPGIVLATFIMWGALLWLGWTLIFASAPEAVVESYTGVAADFWARFYFAGGAITTAGTSDYRPIGPVFQTLTPLAAMSGFFFISLTVSYIASVISAVIRERVLSEHILSYGRTPAEFVQLGWNGRDFSTLDHRLATLLPDLIELEQRHFAFPVLHFFGEAERSRSTPVAITVLDEALTIIMYGIAQEQRPDMGVVLALRRTLDKFLATTVLLGLDPHLHPPPLPDLAALRAAGVPVIDAAAFRTRTAELAGRRARLATFLAAESWPWEAVWTEPVEQPR